MTDNCPSYAVFGDPVDHSLSPEIHQIFARQTGQAISYTKQKVELEGFEQAVGRFFAAGGKGLNITVPFKQRAYTYAGRLTERARQAGAVNTLILQDDGVIRGDNTDGVGLVRDIKNNLGWQIAGKRVLVLGAGGAVRGVLGPLLEERPARLHIVNRTAEKAKQLARGFIKQGVVSGYGLDELNNGQYDLVINGTSTGLTGESLPLPDDLLATGACGYDMVYGAKPTPFMAWATQAGAVAVADGLGMLVEQAAESFDLWRGVHPQTTPVISTLRSRMSP